MAGGPAQRKIKVQAILNEIAGFDHTGKHRVGTPAIFGMNFQSVSVGQKLKIGGYQDPVATPSANLANTIAFADRSIGQMVEGLRDRGRLEKTVIIISAKHGQSPIDRTKRVALDDSAVIAAPIGANFAFDISDDGSLIWLKDNSGNKRHRPWRRSTASPAIPASWNGCQVRCSA